MIKNIMVGMLIILTISAISFYLIFSPSYTSQLHYNGQKITIDRDSYGIPHIHSPSRKGYLYALGNLMAEDRLYQCTFRRILGQGRLSQYLGEKTLKVDINMRDLGLAKLAHHIADKMKREAPDSFADFDAYSQGINDGVARRKAFPIEFHILGIKWQNWTVADIYTLNKVLEWTVSHGLTQQYTRSYLLSNFTVEEIDKILPQYKKHYAFDDVQTIKEEDIPEHLLKPNYLQNGDFQPLQIEEIVSLGTPEYYMTGQGSNAGVVSGRHTESGKPLLFADPHLQSLLPSHWYQIRANFWNDGKETSFVGVTPPGIPIAYGKSKYYSVGLTILNTDNQDAFKQEIKNNKYYFNGEWRSLKARKQKIMIKGDSGLVEYDHEVKLTHRGPVINYIVSSIGIYDVRKDSLSISWTGYNQDFTSLSNVSKNIQASNFDQLQYYLTEGNKYFISLSGLGITSDDNIFYFQSGLNPRRTSMHMVSYIKDGTTSKYDWLGFMPHTDRLLVNNPKCGYIVTANNRPASDKCLDGYFNQVIFSARASRLQKILSEQLASGRKITNKFARQVLYDTVDIYCQQILPQINSVLPKANSILHNFTCDFKPDSYQATLYEVFFAELWKVTKLLPHNGINYLSMYPAYQALYNHVHQAYKGNFQNVKKMELAWTNMENQLEQFFKTKNYTTWKWGIFHKDIQLQMPLGPHPVLGKLYNRQTPGWGNLHTINVARASKIQHDNFATTHRANYRSVFDYGGPSWWVIDGGVSQNLLSSHYDDQWKLFTSQKLIPIDSSPSTEEQL